jgi:lysozyme family protein
MTPEAQDVIIGRVIQREGGVNDVGDGKGVTRWGQTQGWLDQFNLPTPETPEDAAENYRAWLRLTKLDAVIADRADAFADFVIDFAVHSGHQTAIRAMQQAIGKVTVDGVIGPKTIAHLQFFNDDLESRQIFAVRVMALRIKFQGNIITQDPHQHARFARSWGKRNAEMLWSLL